MSRKIFRKNKFDIYCNFGKSVVEILMMETATVPSTDPATKPFEFGEEFFIADLDDKRLVHYYPHTKIREGNFLLSGPEIIVQAGPGIKISSRHPNILVISANLDKYEEKILQLKNELEKRVGNLERAFTSLLRPKKS